jgi:hypothetical protein
MTVTRVPTHFSGEVGECGTHAGDLRPSSDLPSRSIRRSGILPGAADV